MNIYIRKEQDGWKKYKSESTIRGGGLLQLPAELEHDFDMLTPYITISVTNGLVVSVADDTAARIASQENAPEPEPTAQDDVDAMMVDHEYRLTILELGVNE